jgi:hypothetical protein
LAWRFYAGLFLFKKDENIFFGTMSYTTFARMTRDEFFKVVPARQFFTRYCPEVKRYYHKLNGIDGNKQPIDFTNEDKAIMHAAVKKLAKELTTVKF